MPDVSILMTLREDFSDKIERMRSAGGRFSKALDEIERKAKIYDDRMDDLSDTQAKLTAELAGAEEALRRARKEFAADPTDDAQKSLDGAAEAYGRLKSQVDSVTAAIRGVRGEQSRLNSDLNRMENGTYGGGSAGGASAASALATSMSAMWKAGLGNMLGGAVSEFAGAQIGSLVDQETGTYASGIMGGLATGAAIGSMISPLWGTLVGAVVGGVSGLVKSATEVFEQRDDAFKSYVQEQYDTLTGTMQDSLDAGSVVAGSREQTRLAFEQRFGSSQAAEDYLARVQDFAQDTNYSYDEIVGYSKLLLNSYDPEQVFSVLERLSDASAALNLESSDVTTLISGLSRMRTTGKTTQEYLNFFSERGIDVYEALSLSTGADKSEISDMVTHGDIAGADAAQAILDYIASEYGGLSDRLAGTYDAMRDNLEDARTTLDAAMGEGFNETRKAGMEAEIDFLSGASGQMMEDAYGMIGQWQASLVNLKEQYNRDALTAVMGGEISDSFIDQDTGQLTEAGERLQEMQGEYARLLADYESGSQEAGAKMGALLAEAQAIAINAYNASDGYRQELESQLGLADRLQQDAALQDAYWDAGYVMGQKFTEGLRNAQAELAIGSLTPAIDTSGMTEDEADRLTRVAGQSKAIDNFASSLWSGVKSIFAPDIPTVYEEPDTTEAGMTVRDYGVPSHADGLRRVPYDDYPAMLHQDERVLTAAEARGYDEMETSLNKGSRHAGGLRRVPYNDYPVMLHQDERVLTAAEARGYDEMETSLNEGSRHADGLRRVPYDDYPAILHQDERVLTAAEARSYDSPAPSVTVTVTGNEFNVRGDSDIDDIAAAIAERVVDAHRLM